MGLLDAFHSEPESTRKANSAHGVNDIPAPRSDASVNAPPKDQHKRVIDFVREAPTARYTFDSRANKDVADAELCRVTPDGGKSCIQLGMNSKALFKSMQSLDFYCALPAEPTRTYMECNRMPR